MHPNNEKERSGVPFLCPPVARLGLLGYTAAMLHFMLRPRLVCLLTLLAALVFQAVAALPAAATLHKASEVVRAPAGFPSLVSGSRVEGPVDFCGEPVPLGEPDVRQRLEKELLLVLWNRAQMLLYLKRSGKYFPYIEAQLKARGMPDDIKYLAVIESALKPHSGSRRGAVGFWQFIRPTARRYGLRVDGFIDERRSLYTSTRAALDYLSDLHDMFSSWSLAAAAYNMGEDGLKKRIRAQGVEEYHRLHLPRETQAYVFRAMAVRRVMQNPARYGFHMTAGDYWRPDEFERVRAACPHGVPLRAVADAARTWFKVIKDLNPQLLGDELPRGTHELLVPPGSGKGFSALFAAQVAKHKPKVKTYVVRRGDTLLGIARKFKVSLDSLLKRNKLGRSSTIHPGQRLTIPR